MDTVVTNFRKSKKDNWNKSMTQDAWKNIYIVESSKTEFSGIGEDNENGSLYWIKGVIQSKARNNKIGFKIGLITLILTGIAFGSVIASVIIELLIR